MSEKKQEQREKPRTEEIEWTDEDDAIMDRVMARLRARGVKADPVKPIIGPIRPLPKRKES